MIHHGDCVEVMATLPESSVDAIVTDPPYGLEFMGKSWDRLDGVGAHRSNRPTKGAPSEDLGDRLSALPSYNGSANVQCRKCDRWRFSGSPCVCSEPDFPNARGLQATRMQAWHQLWAVEAFRVAKPGAFLLAFGGTRTVHRLASAIEDAGWEIRDCLVWAYASGFPKSLNFPDGTGTALKPAWEPIVMARKPLTGTVAANRERLGTGALNIDAARIPISAEDAETWVNGGGYLRPGSAADHSTPVDFKQGLERNAGADPTKGRWPANVLLTDPIFDGGVEGVVGGGETVDLPLKAWTGPAGDDALFSGLGGQGTNYHDSGTYSRFFLVPKADRADREPVLGGVDVDVREHAFDSFNASVGNTVAKRRRNSHPTVKPTDLMRHLVRLVTPPGGTVLDPFLGSGTTAIAAELEGFPWIGIEREAEYVAIAEARLNGTQRGLGLSA